MPYLDSNMLSKIFYASVGSEILRISRTTADLIRMVTCANLLLIRMKEQSSECVRIFSLLKKKIFGKHFTVFHKFADTPNEFIKLSSLLLIYIFVYVCLFLSKPSY